MKLPEKSLSITGAVLSPVLSIFFFCLFGFFDTFHDLSQIFKFVLLFNFVKLLSAFFHIHEALFSLPGTSLASLLSHLNVFNLHRIANHSNDMQNLI